MTDARVSDEVAYRVASRLGHALHGRTISVGCSEHHLAFPGTISLKTETLRRIILDYTDSLARGGFKRIIFLPFHGGNFLTVEEAVKTARTAHRGIRVIGVTDLKRMFGCLSGASAEFGVTPGESGGHSGESETSIMMFLEKNLVVRDRFAPGYVGQMGDQQRGIMHERGMHALTRNGVIGDPTKASARKGGVYIDRLTDFVLQEIENQS
jgi:creatinine amidohydrolase